MAHQLFLLNTHVLLFHRMNHFLSIRDLTKIQTGPKFRLDNNLFAECPRSFDLSVIKHSHTQFTSQGLILYHGCRFCVTLDTWSTLYVCDTTCLATKQVFDSNA